ncbi:hypothetical protein N8I77_006180 [Diaporthe amygdali]|uniref:Methyltransferase type 11 domain-containing protein n=1 Tax=Phomopsis amygdali TaxID=1214568 RepID=A0AAD9SFE0_PHOAM|nr:hypothetical protein N8I77_006180 [Diaporthe amygdali]
MSSRTSAYGPGQDQGPAPSDPTFRSYSAAQAATYAAQRGGYKNKLIDQVLSLHQAAGGDLDIVLDVGTGTGQAIRDVAPFFTTAFGVDPGAEMVAKAREIGGTTKTGKGIEFLTCAAEDLDKLSRVEHGSVNLITAGMAAHWFEMPKFWAAAAKVLSPGGSVALWTKSSYYCNPKVTPNAVKVQAILSEFEDLILGPYALPPNKLSQHNYRDLVLPWERGYTASLFDEKSFKRLEWDVGGHLTDGADFFGGSEETTLAEIRDGMSTASMVTRWRDAHPELVGTDQDCVNVLVEKLKAALAVEDGKEAEKILRMGMGTAILFVNRAK